MWNQICFYTSARHCSDHHPIIINQEISSLTSPYSLEFFKTCYAYEDCHIITAHNWNLYAKGNPLQRIVSNFNSTTINIHFAMVDIDI